jgi:Tfp pilus assembly protein PilN
LMPESTLSWQSFNQKKPYLVASVFSLVAVVAAVGLLFDKLASAKNDALQKVHPEVAQQEAKASRFDQALRDLKKTQTDSAKVVGWMDNRFYWAQVMTELRNVLTKVEGNIQSQLGANTGIWIEQFRTFEPRVDLTADASGGEENQMSDVQARLLARQRFLQRYGLVDRSAGATAAAPAKDSGATQTADATASKKKKGDTNEVSSVTITFRAVSLNSIKPGANKEIVYAVLGGITSDPLFDPDPAETKDTGTIGDEEAPGTFTFKLIVGLKRPLSL